MVFREIGKRIQQAREEDGITQEELAARLGCTQSALSNYELGKRRLYLNLLTQIAQVLNRPLEYFMDTSAEDTGSNDGDNARLLADPVLREILVAAGGLPDNERKLVLDYINWRKNAQMISFTLSDEQLALQKTAREFANTNIRPYARDLDRMPTPHFDWKIVDRFAASGYTSAIVPKEFGGRGLDNLSCAIMCEELAVACSGISGVLGGTMLAVNSLKVGGTEEQKKKYLPLFGGNKGRLGAAAITEYEAGSDMGGTTTLARKDGDSYLLSGVKCHITNAGIADLYIVLATTDPSRKYAGLDFFIVPGDAPGLSVGKIDDKMGLRAEQTGEIVLNNVRVPAENVLGKSGTGFLLAMQILDVSRPMVSVNAIGVARAAYEAALDFTRKRHQFGRPLFANQAVAFALADMATAIDAGRLLIWRACDMIDHNLEYTREASMAKLFASEAAVEICSKAMHLMGAAGYTRDLPVEKYLRDAKALTVLEGTSEVQRHIISGQL